jgi:leucyl/phenylalanyl-tRNA--protein transferase
VFPDPSAFDHPRPLLSGADFEPATIIAAYRAGWFPWPHEDEEYLWCSPDPRTLILPGGLHVSRRLRRTLRQGRFTTSRDRAFEAVIRACAVRNEGTWITEALIAAYVELHRLGWGHSIEVWDADGALAGGLYGLRVGAMFGAESMFHRATDASKVAMAAMMDWVAVEGIAFVDVQMLTGHLERMGAVEVSRDDYLTRLAAALDAADYTRAS